MQHLACVWLPCYIKRVEVTVSWLMNPEQYTVYWKMLAGENIGEFGKASCQSFLSQISIRNIQNVYFICRPFTTKVFLLQII